MQNHRFQTTLITALALGLGFSLASSQAIGYPAAPAVSLGANPIQSFAGTIPGTGSTSLFTVDADQDFIVTDISFAATSTDTDCMDMIDAQLTTESGAIAAYDLSTRYCYSSNCYSDAGHVGLSLTSGLRVPAGSSLSLETDLYNSWTWTGCSSGRDTKVKYTIAGYYAQP